MRVVLPTGCLAGLPLHECLYYNHTVLTSDGLTHMLNPRHPGSRRVSVCLIELQLPTENLEGSDGNT